MAALPSANESPLYFSFGASPSAYMVAQKSATALPLGSSKVALPSSTSCLPPRLGGVQRVEVEPGLEELAGRRRPDRRLCGPAGHDLAAGGEELVVRRQRRVLRVDAGLLHQVLVVEDHHRVGLPRHLVELAVRGLVLVGRGAACGPRCTSSPPGKSSRGTSPPCFWNCGTAAGEVLKTRHGALPAVMAAPMTSSEDLPAGISWAVTFSLGVLGVPGGDHRLAPGELLGVVRQPDLDRALDGEVAASRRGPPLLPPQAAAPRARASEWPRRRCAVHRCSDHCVARPAWGRGGAVEARIDEVRRRGSVTFGAPPFPRRCSRSSGPRLPGPRRRRRCGRW